MPRARSIRVVDFFTCLLGTGHFHFFRLMCGLCQVSANYYISSCHATAAAMSQDEAEGRPEEAADAEEARGVLLQVPERRREQKPVEVRALRLQIFSGPPGLHVLQDVCESLELSPVSVGEVLASSSMCRLCGLIMSQTRLHECDQYQGACATSIATR